MQLKLLNNKTSKTKIILLTILISVLILLLNKYYPYIVAPTDNPVLLFVFLIFGTFISEDLTCISAGIFITQGFITFPTASLACFIGISVGDIVLYGTGRLIGSSLLKKPPFTWALTPEKIEKASRWIHKRGAIIILTSRFLPGTRLATYLAAGALKIPFMQFLVYFITAAALWTPFFIFLSFAWGSIFLELFEHYKFYALPAIILTLISFWFVYKIFISLFTWKGRRLILSRYYKIIMWEFWPTSIFYAPVFLYILYLGFIKYRKPVLFTVTNPAIPYSGFWKESKFNILSSLAKNNSNHVAPFTLISNKLSKKEKSNELEIFIKKEQLSYPIVLKPNEGERGKDVQIIKTKDEAYNYLNQHDQDSIAQKFVPGLEFGIFYYRFPDEKKGHIFSITQKTLFSLIGNGTQTLEQLLLSNSRSLVKIKYFLKKFENQLETVPENEAFFVLSDVGAHRFGTFCTDTTHLATKELLSVLDQISINYKGFYFGRFDIKTDSIESLKNGSFKILELNGVTSESTNIFDSKSSNPFKTFATLLKQWQLAFKIANKNIKNGAKSDSTFKFIIYFFKTLFREKSSNSNINKNTTIS